MTITIQIEEPSNIDLARLDDDGGNRQQSTVETRLLMRDRRISTPMIPGAREPGVLTTFGMAAVVSEASSRTMDAATIAASESGSRSTEPTPSGAGGVAVATPGTEAASTPDRCD